MTNLDASHYLNQIKLPSPHSHKGQNGKVMVIGGSELFHAASQWALTVVSRMVDMVFYSSVPSNNELIKEAKLNFHNGIVIPRDEIENYITEADVVLIGPGMERGENSRFQIPNSKQTINQNFKTKNQQIKDKGQMSNVLSKEDWNNDTQKVTNYLLNKFPDKKWIIDAGALQMVDPRLINEKCIITPHQGEFEMLVEKLHSDKIVKEKRSKVTEWQSSKASEKESFNLPENFPRTTMLLKGKIDTIVSTLHTPHSTFHIPGGNVGMTKGGTGDVLAGLVAGLYAFSDDPFAVAVIASHVNKMAGDELFKSTGPFFNASDLADQIPKTLAKVFGFVK